MSANPANDQTDGHRVKSDSIPAPEKVIPIPFGEIRDAPASVIESIGNALRRLPFQYFVITALTVIAVAMLWLTKDNHLYAIIGAFVVAILITVYAYYTETGQQHATSRENRGDEPAQSRDGNGSKKVD